MAVRLHPQFDAGNAEHIRAIEEIAQVPAGTHAAVLTHREEATGLEGDAAYQHWASVQDTPVGELDAFLAYGWGRVTPSFRALAEAIADPEVGDTRDPQQVAALLHAQGVEGHARTLALQRELGIAWH